MEPVHCRSGRVRRGRESILSFLFSGLRQVVGPEWLPGQQSLVELCGPEGLIISSSRLPGRLLDLLPGEPTWEIGREEVAGERMSNYTRQGPAPRHAITFQMGYLPLVQREPAESGTHVVWDRAGQGSARQGREHQADSESGEAERQRRGGAGHWGRTAEGSRGPLHDLPFGPQGLSSRRPAPPCPVHVHHGAFLPVLSSASAAPHCPVHLDGFLLESWETLPLAPLAFHRPF